MNSESIGEYIAVRSHSQAIILSSLPWSGFDEYPQPLTPVAGLSAVSQRSVTILDLYGVSPLLRRRLS